MRPILAMVLGVLLGAAALPAAAAIQRPEKAKLALQADRTAYQAGDTARIAALVAIEPGWHVNSHNPTFDYLIPTMLEIETPAGWPRPAPEYPPAQKKSFTFADVPLSVYDGDVVIQAQVRVPPGTARGAFTLRARLQYQACNDSQCLPPVSTRSQLTLTVGAALHAAADADASPVPGGGPGHAAAFGAPAPLPGHEPAKLAGGGAGSGTGASGAAAGGPAGATEGGAGPVQATAAAPASPGGPLGSGGPLGVATGPPHIAAAAPAGPPGAAATPGASAASIGPRGTAATPGPSAASAGAPGTAETPGASAAFTGPSHHIVGSGARKPAPVAARPAPRPASLAGMLLIALVGGLILNAMPCVLPVLSLKMFGLVRSGAHGRHEMVRGALAIAAGILVSFWALAAVAVAAAAAGSAVGWGIQFQRPGFVAFLAVVVTLFCLNLWGMFEIPLPRALAQLGGAGAREGLAGHFGSGLFATLMATPCSAPFLGTAVGFALSQPAPTVFAIFTAVGTGLALPYLVLAANPGISRLLPRPGPWMETLRGIMGFLLGGSAIWLLYVLAAQVSPERLALFEVGLLFIALCTWLRHQFERRRAEQPRAGQARHAARAGAALAAAAALAVAAVALAATGAGAPGAGSRFAERSGPAGAIAWIAFDRARAESLAAAGQLIFVDVTADWCFTCKVNERLILDTSEVATAFATHHVVPMRADWTNRNDEIARFLADHGRYGIPFYLLYRPGRDPYVFSELPTKTAILAALDAAATPAARQARKL
jgi:thiol:disulfide interchange protein/type II secretory pathway pseudopilin PulG